MKVAPRTFGHGRRFVVPPDQTLARTHQSVIELKTLARQGDITPVYVATDQVHNETAVRKENLARGA